MRHDNICKDDKLGDGRGGRVGSRTIAVYTVLLVLRNMKERVGIEAMVEFIDRYTSTIEQLNPDIKEAVNYELLERALHGLYESVCPHEE